MINNSLITNNIIIIYYMYTSGNVVAVRTWRVKSPKKA